ncbi:MAG: hypothetical protein M3032_04450 [Verrucomicrobiota bacterium]|nr:hypothetical protein [Verrucomicrobiota bacterium]
MIASQPSITTDSGAIFYRYDVAIEDSKRVETSERMPTRNKRAARTILWIECIGFALIILLSWVDELLALPRRLFGGVAHSTWQEAAIESVLTLTVWLVVFVATRRVLRKFSYLEDMLTMCGWCRKLDRGGDWLSLEDYCAKELGIDISHGICPSCGRQLMNADAPVETTR